MVLLMFQESPNMEIYGEVQETGYLPSELCLCSCASFFTSVTVTAELLPKALHSHIQRLRAAGSAAGLTKHICRNPQCLMFSMPEAYQVFQNVH